jgi:hypothetical protein
MTEYTYSEARQNLASLLERAVREGEVRIRRKDGQLFVVKPHVRTESPLSVNGADLGVAAKEIVELVREGRSRYGGPEAQGREASEPGA